MTSAEHMKMKWTDFPATNSAVHMLNCAVPYVCKSNILNFWSSHFGMHCYIFVDEYDHILAAS